MVSKMVRGRLNALILIFIVLSVCLGSGAAVAQPDEFNRRGAYVGLGANYLVSGFQGVAGRLGFGDTAGFNVRGGYRFNEFLAAEGLYEYGDDFGKRFPEGKADVQTNAFFTDVKLILPLERFQPYVGGGIGFLNANANANVRRLSSGTSGTGFAGRVDGGIDFALTRNVSLFSEAAYVMGTGGTIGGESGVGNLYYFSIGFGGKYQF